jgi:hypothetical protein
VWRTLQRAASTLVSMPGARSVETSGADPQTGSLDTARKSPCATLAPIRQISKKRCPPPTLSNVDRLKGLTRRGAKTNVTDERNH